ncbi:hypothetical protein ABE073_04235 [Lederbergia citrisecunda]|uniref:hypothetical protein n=1 Tax=Lederbergia citrisecunda TaxID=2833583 RepID=UPI003D2D749A
MKNVSMELGLHLWDMEDIRKEIKGKGLFEVGKVYKTVDEKLTKACVKYATANDEDKDELLEVCNKLLREKVLVALKTMDDIIISSIKTV